MRDFDPDAYLDQQTSSPPAQAVFDPDAYLDHQIATASTKTAPDWMIQADKPLQGMATPALEATGAALNWPGKALTGLAVSGVSNPYAAAAIGSVPDLAEDFLLGGRQLAKGIESEAPISPMNSNQSISAAAASPNLQTASPELQQAVTQAAQKTGGAVNPDVLARHVEADSLPVPMKLTEGQATQDPVTISTEQNMRGKNPALAQRFNEQNQQLTQNVQAVRDQVGPEVFSTTPVEHGDTLIEAYQDKAAAANADISAKYQSLKDANGGTFPVDAKALYQNATADLHQQLLFDHAPPQVMSTLGRLADNGNMTFENFEALRTNLARIQRSATTDGNTVAAAGVIRNAMEQLPLAPGAADLKPLADTARAAARTQFEALEADPAYKAAVTGSVSPDRFTQRFITGPSATRDGVATMKANLADNPTASQTMGVAAVDSLRQGAGIDQLGNGNFSQSGFNRNYQAMGPRLQELLDPKTNQTLESIGNVARYTQFQPRGSFVNNSNTFTSAMANYGANALEGATNVAFKGVPVGTWARTALKGSAERKAVNQALAPGAGLSRLSSLANP